MITEGTSRIEESSAEWQAYLQARVARYGYYGAIIGASLFVLRLLILGLLFPRMLREELQLGMIWHGVAVLVFAALWLLLRGRPVGAPRVRLLESAATLLVSGSFTMMTIGLHVDNAPDYALLMALTIGLAARSAFVPSTTRRTLVLCALTGALLLLRVRQIFTTNPPAQMAADLHTSLEDLPLMMTIRAAVWWLNTSVLCVLISRVIYGLQMQVRTALRLGQYTLEEKLAEGGMGVIYRASHAMLRRPTAVKLLLPDRAGDTAVLRFEREVQLTAQLAHPNTVTVFDYGRTPEGVFYYAMELLEGGTLERVVEISGPLPESRVVHLLLQTAGALEEAHGIGLIHRDIKPANLMICRRGTALDVLKVVDFGLVKTTKSEAAAAITQANVITGTPLFMAPEVLTDPEHVDAKSDLYALGGVAYFLLTGTHVFEGRTPVEICAHHLHTPPEPPSKRLGRVLAPGMDELVLACLEKRPAERPESARVLLERLRALGVAAWSEGEAQRWWGAHGAALLARETAAVERGMRVGRGH